MHALYLRDLAGRETVTLHASLDDARSSLVKRIKSDCSASLGTQPLDDDALIERYFASGVARYAIAGVAPDL